MPVPAHSIRSRPARGGPPSARISRDPDILASHLEDASHFPGGHVDGLVVASSEADVAEAVRCARTILPIGAQSSLTGGATPSGDTLLSTSRLTRIDAIGRDRVRVQAGVTLVDLDAALAAAGKYYPTPPTFTGAFVGGTVATNAAGAATFKYGTTRDWVRAMTVVLASGDARRIERGGAKASSLVPVPTYRMPAVPKNSAGYFAAAGMDLIDLFIGSEGTLGVITEVTLRVLPRRPALCHAFVTFADRFAALAFVAGLRRASHAVGVSAIEHMDARCL